VAADHPSFDVSALSNVSPDDYGSLVFHVHPAARLVESRYPILAIWKANQADAEAVAPVSLDAGRTRVLIIRREDHVELRELPAPQFALLAAFMRGATLGENADLAFALGDVVKLQALVDFEIRNPS
jgi:hypothetical protein